MLAYLIAGDQVKKGDGIENMFDIYRERYSRVSFISNWKVIGLIEAFGLMLVYL